MKSRHPALTLAALALAGCATTSPLPEKSIVVSADQTEVIMPVGTHIRSRVLKGQQPLSASPTATMSGEQLDNSLLTRDGTIPAVPVK